MIRTNKHRSKYSISINHNKNPNYKEVYILGTKSIMSSIEKDGRYIPISLINITNFQICNILNKENKKHLITIGAGIKNKFCKPQKILVDMF